MRAIARKAYGERWWIWEKSKRRLVDWNGRPNNKIYSCYGYDGERNRVYKRSRYIHVTRVSSTSHVLLRRWPMRIWLRQKLMAADITSVKYEYAYKLIRSFASVQSKCKFEAVLLASRRSEIPLYSLDGKFVKIFARFVFKISRILPVFVFSCYLFIYLFTFLLFHFWQKLDKTYNRSGTVKFSTALGWV